MTSSVTRQAPAPPRRHWIWLALLLPLLAADTFGLISGVVAGFLAIATAAMALLAPKQTARLVPFAFFAYGAYGLFLAHSQGVWDWRSAQAFLVGQELSAPHDVVYGLVRSGPGDNAGYVLPQAVAFLAAGVCLLAVTGAPGGRAVRRALAQLRGTDGQPKTVPPFLLLPVLFLGEELLSQRLWFGWFLNANVAGRIIAVVILAVGVAVVALLPRAAATLAVAGTLVLGVVGLLWSVRPLLPLGPSVTWFTTVFYGAVPLHDRFNGPVALRDGLLPAGVVPGHLGYPASPDGTLVLVLAALQGAALLAVGCLLAPRLLTWTGDAELARRAQALTQRVTRLAETRSDATEVAVAELRRIERDLHDGAQARLVAVGMSLRAAEELMRANPQAALALVAEARETSSRALDDLRDLVRGIYPPVLADRGLADAVRALALDAPVTVDTDITLPGEPPMPVAAAVYFGIAEVLTNAVRHSEADTVQIGIGYAGGMLRATVTDDGVGGADSSVGTGLSGVERRLATFDGILAVSSPPGGPTIVVIEVSCALSNTAGRPPA